LKGWTQKCHRSFEKDFGDRPSLRNIGKLLKSWSREKNSKIKKRRNVERA